MSLRAWPADFPDDIAVQRRTPYEAQADSVMYRQVLAELARARGWDVHLYDAKLFESQAASELGERADEVLRGPRTALGPPWGSSDGAGRNDRGELRLGAPPVLGRNTAARHLKTAPVDLLGNVPTDAGVATENADGEHGAGGEVGLEPPQRLLFGVGIGVTGV